MKKTYRDQFGEFVCGYKGLIRRRRAMRHEMIIFITKWQALAHLCEHSDLHMIDSNKISAPEILLLRGAKILLILIRAIL